MFKQYVSWLTVVLLLVGAGIFFITIPVSVQAQASPLDAIDDFYTMTIADAALTGNVLTNDIGSGLYVTQWNDPDHGSINGAADGSFVYTPEPGYVGTAIFYYTIYDANGARDASTVMITISGGTTALRAVNDTFEVMGNGITTSPVGRDFATPGVLANDSGDSIRVSSYTQPANSNLRDVIVQADGSFRFVLYPLFVGTDTFTYTITDAAGHTATATVTLNVVRPPLDAVDDAYTVEFESRNNLMDVMSNDTASGRRFGITIPSGPAHGTYTYLGYNSAVSYTPDPGFSGTDSFRYRLSDPFGTTDEATVTITVLPPGPIDASDDFFELSSDSPGLVANVLNNDHGVGLRVTEYTPPSRGTVHNMSEDGWFGYTPEPGYIGSVVFYYTIYDTNGQRDASTVTITITQGSQPPLPSPLPPPPPSVPSDAIDDFYTMTTADAALTGNVLTNDIGSGLYVTQWNDPDHGSINGAADGSFVYTPEPGYVGTAIFYYTIYDANGARDASTVMINVIAPAPAEGSTSP